MIKVKLWCNMGIKDLNLLQRLEIYSNRLFTTTSTYKIMSVFDIATNGHLSSGITMALLLYRPLTPVERIDCPRCKVIAICRHRIKAVVGVWICAHGAIRQARFSERPNVRQT